MVEPFIATRERVAQLWHHLQEFPYLQEQLGLGSVEALVARLEDRRTLLFDLAEGKCLLAAIHVVPRLDADVYVAGWDHHLAGREEAIREGLRTLFRLAALRRVTMKIPDQMTVLVKLARRLGFSWEGVLREELG